MADIQQHESMDRVLKFLIENPDKTRNDGYIHSNAIKEKLFPGQDSEVVNFILKKIIDSGGDIVKTQIRDDSVYHLDGFFKATVFTNIFLFNQGGFTSLYEKIQKEEKENLILEEIKREKLINDSKLSRWQVKAFPYVFTIGLVGGIYSIISIFILIFGESTDKKIERILESKLKEKPKTEQVLVVPTSKSTLTKKQK